MPVNRCGNFATRSDLLLDVEVDMVVVWLTLKEHSTKNILRCKQEIVLTLGYLRSLKGQFFLGKEELFIEV
jgi:hypothetical protein